MRIGTFMCLLFGHKFIYSSKTRDGYHKYIEESDVCVRCGIDKEVKNGG